MSVSAVVRVKRKLDEEPSDAIVLNCKKRKLDASSEEQTELSRAVLKFAGTVQENENLLDHLRKQNKSELDILKESFKKHEVNITKKLREESKTNSKNNRYRVVNYLRSSNSDTIKICSDLEQSGLTILDVESDVHKTNASEETKNTADEQKYVYDLYYTNSDDLGDPVIDDYISIHPLNDKLIFGSSRDNGINEPDSDDSEDSNAENNWRNDYPDESDLESINENDMVQAIGKLDLDDDLSSDDGEEGFVYSIDSEAAGFEEDIDESDVHRYGERYARFKAKHKHLMTSDLKEDFHYGDIDEEDDYY